MMSRDRVTWVSISLWSKAGVDYTILSYVNPIARSVLKTPENDGHLA